MIKFKPEKIDKMMKKSAMLRKKMSTLLPDKIDINRRARQKLSIYQYSDEYNKKTLEIVATTFKNNIEYHKRMKQRDIEEDYTRCKTAHPEIDPRIKYMKRCLENLDLSLPILDKIYRKTLCLQDYHLSDGNCQGLAEACEFLDTTVVNRMLFNNCGLQGDQLSLILDGIAKMRDFKALILRLSTVHALSLEKLLPIF